MKLQTLTSVVAAIFDAAKRLDTGPVHAPALSRRGFGRSGGSFTVRPAANMDGAEVRSQIHDATISDRLWAGSTGSLRIDFRC